VKPSEQWKIDADLAGFGKFLAEDAEMQAFLKRQDEVMVERERMERVDRWLYGVLAVLYVVFVILALASRGGAS